MGAGRERDRRGHLGQRAEPVPRRLQLEVGRPFARRDEGHSVRRTGPDRGCRGSHRRRARGGGRERGDRFGRRRARGRRRRGMGTHRRRDGEGNAAADRIEARLADFTELVATAISSSETREQHAAGRRAGGAAAGRDARRPRGAARHVFDAVAAQLGRLLDAASSGLIRFEDEPRRPRGRLGPAGRGGHHRRSAADRRRERHHEDRADRPAGAHRRLRPGGQRRDRRAGAPAADEHRDRLADPSRRPPMGLALSTSSPLRFRVNNTWAGEIHPTSGNVFFGFRLSQHQYDRTIKYSYRGSFAVC